MFHSIFYLFKLFGKSAEAYSQIGSENAGKSIQTIAKVIFYINLAITALLAILSLAGNPEYLILILPVGLLLTFVVSTVLLGLAVLVENSTEIRKNTWEIKQSLLEQSKNDDAQ